MKPRSVLILFGILAGVCVAYWLVLLGEERSERHAYEAKRLFDFAPEAVQTVTIQREGERATAGERREQGSWTITAPYSVPANPIVWDRVAKNLSELLSERIVYESAPEDLEEYGLAQPVLEVDATTESGETLSLAFGSMEPTQKYRYGLLEEGPLFLVSTDQFFELDRDLSWLRDRNLIKKGNEGISRIEFARMARDENAPEGATGPETWKESVTVVAERREDGIWHVLEPDPSVADQETLNQMASEIQFAVGREYVDDPESYTDYQLDPPKARISVVTESAEEKQAFYLGAFSTGEDTEGGVFVKQEGRPAVFVVDAHMVTLLPETPTAWHEKRLVTRPGSDISAIEYTAGEQHFRLATDKDKPWRLAVPRDEEVDQGAVSQFVGMLLNMNGNDYWSEARPEFGLDDPIIRIQLEYGEGGETGDIRVGALTPDGDARYVTQDTGDVTSLPAEAVEQLVVTSADFAPRGLLTFREADATEVSLVFEGVNYRFTRGESAWRVSEPAGKVWESQSDMRALLEALRTLRATGVERSTAPPNLVPYGLEDPVLVAGVSTRETPKGEETIHGPVTIGSLCEDKPHERYAMAAGRLDLFRVKQDIIDTVRDVLRGVVDETAP
ncbi:MAG: DUF4340 domain-containing protein [Candidatus Hydrogenedentes bacterium]|nr:DUF4340 domain-containing protein [Candidatus Hydrogenedentota bacterium]